MRKLFKRLSHKFKRLKNKHVIIYEIPGISRREISPFWLVLILGIYTSGFIWLVYAHYARTISE